MKTIFANKYNSVTPELISSLVTQNMRDWDECSPVLHSLKRTFSRSEKASNETRIKNFVKKINGKDYSGTITKSAGFIKSAGLLLDSIGLGGKYDLRKLNTKALTDITRGFVKQCCAFDSLLTDADIYQAARNMWIMLAIQKMFNLEVRLTPAIFAYSLLYPYCDNYIDDTKISLKDKINLGLHLYGKLSGEKVVAENENERKIFALIEMIEEQYDRREFRDVYKSLLTIHGAQIKSLSLQYSGKKLTPGEVMAIAMEKGGTSVFADGYLVAGRLDDKQQEIVFSLGVVLQLLDDMQDIEEDKNNGIDSVFIQALNCSAPDEQACRAINYCDSVFQNVRLWVAEDNAGFIDMLNDCVKMFFISSSGSVADVFSDKYFETVEPYLPTGIAFMKDNKNKLYGYVQKIFTEIKSDPVYINPVHNTAVKRRKGNNTAIYVQSNAAAYC